MLAVEEDSGSQSSPWPVSEVVEKTQRDVKELTNIIFKINPSAKEFEGSCEFPLNCSGDSNKSNASLNHNEREITRIRTFGNQQCRRRRGDRQHWRRWINNDKISQADIEDCIQRDCLCFKH